MFNLLFSGAFAVDGGVDYVNCVKSTYRYYPTDGANFRKTEDKFSEMAGTFTCSPYCIRSWMAISIPETNLKLVKVDPACPCIKKEYDWRIKPTVGKYFRNLREIKKCGLFSKDRIFSI